MKAGTKLIACVAIAGAAAAHSSVSTAVSVKPGERRNWRNA